MSGEPPMTAIQPLRLALIGFGAVGQGLVEILEAKGDWLASEYGLHSTVVAVTTRSKGSLYRPDGLALPRLLTAIKQGNLSYYPDESALVRDLGPFDVIRQTNANCVIEVSVTNLNTGEPALSYVRAAFEAGQHVIVANKGPVALAYSELADQAKAKGLFFGYEATVMGGTPALRLAQSALAGCTIQAVRGILNGTSNYILTQMGGGLPYADALADAQRLGYAEADPSADVEGFDAAGKLIILTNIVLGRKMTMDDLYCTDITQISPADIESARASGERWKLVAQATISADGVVTIGVKPERLPLSDPLAGVSGAMNAVTYQTDLLGPVTLVGRGAGGKETGFALLSDLLALVRSRGA